RACKRCRPNELGLAERRVELVEKICRLIDASDEEPTLEALARHAGTSLFHLHRMFKAVTGVTPKAYAAAKRARRAREALRAKGSVTEAIYGAGYGSSGRFYAASNGRLGMTPSAYRAGGRGLEIRFAVGRCSL